ncbi:MAG: hypothetical protein GY926_09185 [bacterium]|nr:hypothetical protein [bacterium]
MDETTKRSLVLSGDNADLMELRMEQSGVDVRKEVYRRFRGRAAATL